MHLIKLDTFTTYTHLLFVAMLRTAGIFLF